MLHIILLTRRTHITTDERANVDENQRMER